MYSLYHFMTREIYVIYVVNLFAVSLAGHPWPKKLIPQKRTSILANWQLFANAILQIGVYIYIYISF